MTPGVELRVSSYLEIYLFTMNIKYVRVIRPRLVNTEQLYCDIAESRYSVTLCDLCDICGNAVCAWGEAAISLVDCSSVDTGLWKAEVQFCSVYDVSHLVDYHHHIMDGSCVSVCLSSPSGTFCAARTRVLTPSWLPWAPTV